ncbi:PREDICTED: pituitary adenylate cyclase-activating polypeptide [Charadrius vociferus]|uniref:pituitary adenylate cyclase-activating polypeptide n=1 Tax=Charadrius vociferus TaxID=50402 RepID=UPI00052144CD|nr:PREDICTED: pituitary adenylate cyclase-activating polypeptide [Charadrius vociferus]
MPDADGRRRLPGFPHPAAAASRASPLIRGLFPPPRHADGIFNKAYRKLLGQLSARKYLHSLMAKRVGYRKQMAVKKYLAAVLGKRYKQRVKNKGRRVAYL